MKEIEQWRETWYWVLWGRTLNFSSSVFPKKKLKWMLRKWHLEKRKYSYKPKKMYVSLKNTTVLFCKTLQETIMFTIAWVYYKLNNSLLFKHKTMLYFCWQPYFNRIGLPALYVTTAFHLQEKLALVSYSLG